jgi:antitoxin CptB
MILIDREVPFDLSFLVFLAYLGLFILAIKKCRESHMKAVIISPRLRWACRRGMLELDVLLGNFLEEVFLQLELSQQEIFIQLLAIDDQTLFNWLMAKASPTDPAFISIVKRIRQHATERHHY